ncbi:MAG: DUF1294 domain-containing protein [Planctomycetota bacterium]
MGLRATPILYTLVPTLAVATGLYIYLADTLDYDRLWIWLAAINAVALPLWAFDKMQSKRKGGFRVPEKTLHLTAAAGGAPMSLAAMQLLRHKTLHKHFRWIYIGLMVPWGLVVFFWLSRP